MAEKLGTDGMFPGFSGRKETGNVPSVPVFQIIALPVPLEVVALQEIGQRKLILAICHYVRRNEITHISFLSTHCYESLF
jgi:hypothetical protein